MSNKRSTFIDREKQLRLAIRRIEIGRSRTKAMALSISSVAREAGVSTALIHNHHPAIAEQIRGKLCRSSRAQRDIKQLQLKAERAKNKELRAEANALRKQIAKLASINERLNLEVRTLKAIRASKNIAPIM